MKRSTITPLQIFLTLLAFLMIAPATIAQDVKPVVVVSPFHFSRENTDLSFSSSENVEVMVTNVGGTNENSIPVFFDFNAGTTTGSANYSSSTVFPMDTVTVTGFSNTINPQAFGTYTLTVWTALPGDIDPSNDTIVYTIRSVDNPAITLPFVEDFDAAPNFTITNDTYAMDSLQQWDFFTAKQDTGRLRSFGGSGFPASNPRAMTLDVITALGQFDTVGNHLMLTIDMTNYDVQDDVLMDFDFLSHGEDANISDLIEIRGSDQDDWLVLYDYDPASLSPGVYNHASGINISVTLDDEGHDYSESTQIRFSQTDNNAAVDIFGADGMTFDNIFIYEPLFVIQDPDNDTICSGDTAVYNMQPSAAPYAYQWQVNQGANWSNIANGANYIGANSQSLQVANPPTGWSGYQYRCVLMGLSSGLDTTAAATLTINTGGSLNLGPDTAFCLGDSVLLDAGSGFAGYSWNTTDMTQTITVQTGGTYTVTVTDMSSCTAADSIVVTANTTVPAAASLTICAGDSALLGGMYQTTAGSYVDTIVVMGSCDTVLTTTLTVTPAPVSNTTLTICLGDSALLGGSYQTMPGSYNDTVSTLAGCDSVVITQLMVDSGQVMNLTASICMGDSILLGGSYQTTAGTYNDTLASMATGCDSILSTMLTILMPDMDTISISICQGDSVMAGGAFQTTTGMYMDSYTNANNCDSIVYTDLTVTTVILDSVSVSICAGDSVMAGGAFQTTSGVYVDSLMAGSGCDSVVTTTVTVNPTLTDSTGLSICAGDSAMIGGVYQTMAGTYYDTLMASTGCDSIVQFTLIVMPTYGDTVDVEICAGDSAFAGGAWQTMSGMYLDTLSGSNTCDSIVSTNLIVNSVVMMNAADTVCQGDSVFVGGAWQTTAGNYSDTLPAANGCDTLLVTALAVSTGPTVTIITADDTLCLGDTTTLTASGAVTYSWTPSAALSSSTGASVMAWPINTITFNVTGVDGNGCEGDGSFTQIVDSCNTFVSEIFGGISLQTYIDRGAQQAVVVLGDGSPGAYNVRIFNALGQQIELAQVRKPQGTTTHRVDLQGQPTGVYIIRVEHAGEAVSTKVFKD